MARTVPCPECAVLFDPRGIKSHLASAHARLLVNEKPAPSIKPEPASKPAEPAPAPASSPIVEKPRKSVLEQFDADADALAERFFS